MHKPTLHQMFRMTIGRVKLFLVCGKSCGKSAADTFTLGDAYWKSHYFHQLHLRSFSVRSSVSSVTCFVSTSLNESCSSLVRGCWLSPWGTGHLHPPLPRHQRPAPGEEAQGGRGKAACAPGRRPASGCRRSRGWCNARPALSPAPAGPAMLDSPEKPSARRADEVTAAGTLDHDKWAFTGFRVHCSIISICT